MSIIDDIHWMKEVHKAGFDVADAKLVKTNKGSAWSATLVYGRLRIVTATNHGGGGKDRLEVCDTTNLPRVILLAHLDKFRSLPAVVRFAQELALASITDRLGKAYSNRHQLETESLKIQAGDLLIDDETLGLAIFRFVATSEATKKLKRASLSQVLWVPKCEEPTQGYFAIPIPDNPKNRELVMVANKERFGYFVADIL